MITNISLRIKDQRWNAISAQVKGEDVYVNYLGEDRGMPTSFHASGQYHHKFGKRYVESTGGLSGAMEVMRQFRTKPVGIAEREHVVVYGWQISRIPNLLPAANGQPGVDDMVVDISSIPAESAIGLEFSVVGPNVAERPDVLGFPIIQRHRVSDGVIIEIEAFTDDQTENE